MEHTQITASERIRIIVKYLYYLSVFILYINLFNIINNINDEDSKSNNKIIIFYNKKQMSAGTTIYLYN